MVEVGFRGAGSGYGPPLRSCLAYLAGDGSAREVFSIWDEGRLVAHAAVFPRRILHDGGDLEVMAPAHVCVEPARRGSKDKAIYQASISGSSVVNEAVGPHDPDPS